MSAKAMLRFLLPSSTAVQFIVGAAARMTPRPVMSHPVRLTISTPGPIQRCSPR